MDADVIRAMTKWPNVPHVYGWLHLDRRGRWLLKGQPIRHPGLVAFINRNYLGDERGRWFFQNGPQRVFVSLDYTPLVCRLDGLNQLITHCQQPIQQVHQWWLDESGNLLLESEQGPCLLRDDQLQSISERFRNRDGTPMKTSAMEQAILATTNGNPGDLYLSWQNELCPVAFRTAADTAPYFGFTTRPKPTS